MAKDITKILEKWGEDVVQDMGAFLDTVNKTNTGTLKNSLRFDIRQDADTIVMQLKSASYGEFVRLGVQGIGPGKNKAPGSPFKFGAGTKTPGGGLRASIDKWTIQKGLSGTRDKKGRFIKRKTLVFLISRSIYRFGITPTNFVFPFFKRMDELTALIGKDASEQIAQQIITQLENAKK